METEDVVAVYQQGGLSGADLQGAVDEALAEVAEDASALQDLGLTADQVSGLRFQVVEESGMDPATILLTILLGMAAEAAYDVSRGVARRVWIRVLAKVREKRGDDAVGEAGPVGEQPKESAGG